MKRQRYSTCMQHQLTFRRGGARASINPVAHDGTAQQGRMNADLMRATGMRVKFDPAAHAIGRFDGAAHSIVGDGGLAVRIGLHFPTGALVWDFVDREFDAAFVLARAPVDDGPIGLAHLPAGKKVTHLAQRLRVPPENKAAGGLAVEAVAERGRTRQAELKMHEGHFKIRAAAETGMDRNTSGLIDDENHAVAIKHARFDFGLGDGRGGGIWHGRGFAGKRRVIQVRNLWGRRVAPGPACS